jgi:hypothetical protein
LNAGRDNFDRATAEALAKRAAHICSNPDCRAQTIAPSTDDETKVIYIGKAAHICAASSGGPRFDAAMSPEERKGIDNGIFLCSNCAEMIDKNRGKDFPVELLQRWKGRHESWVRDNLNKRSQQAPVQQIFNVTSHSQQGGITAGVVNVGPQPRRLDLAHRNQLAQLLPDKSRTVTIECVMGDSESFTFATEIKDYLKAQGYSVNGIDQVVFAAPVLGQDFDPDTLTLTIGTRQ